MLQTMTSCLVAQTLGFGTGVVMSVLLLTLLWRGHRRQTGARGKYQQAIFALMWHLGGLMGMSLRVIYGERVSLWMALAVMLNFVGAAFFPLGFLALWQRPRDEHSWRAKACWWLCSATLVSASVLTLLFVLHFFNGGQPSLIDGEHTHSEWHLGRALAYHVAFATLAGTLLLLRGRLNNFAARFYAATTLVGALTPAMITTLAHGVEAAQTHVTWMQVIEQQAPLLILFGAVVYFGDFRFSNVYVKSCLRFLTALLLALGAGLLLLFVLPSVSARLTAFPTAALVIAATAALTLWLCGFAWLLPKLDHLVDYWLFREPDYAAVTRELWHQLSQQEDDAAIFASVAQLAQATLGLQAARVIPLPALPADHLAAALNSGEVCELKANDSLRTAEHINDDVEFLAPIRVAGQPAYALALAPGAQRRSLLHSELDFLRGLAGQASSRLETLAVERARIEQQSKEERLRRQVTEAELRALRTQINPHFLFNSLNTIADLIVADPTQAEQVTVQLAKIFRHVLRSSDRQMISVHEELDFLKTWLDIEAVRFGDRLRVQFSLDETLNVANVPSLILQPLVENALKHGLAPKLGGGTLQVGVARAGRQLSLTVEDDGMGFPSHTETVRGHGHGIGLRNVAERLTTIYAGRAQMLCETVATGGSRVTLLLPLEV
ncbi:MAG: histidine kinase [Acidobacteria bacterium]|nr:histidine kinase [Acidobacteriota bacterium]